jgi:sulfur carrier protein
MRIRVNGHVQEVPEDTTVAALIERLGLSKAPCAAEVNKELVPKRLHPDRHLQENDSIELVTLVGGG